MTRRPAWHLPARPGVALVVSAAAFTLTVLSTSIVNIALPDIGDDLGGGVAGLQWVANGYNLMLASLLLSAGVLCDQRGARRMMLIGLALFFTGGMIAVLAPNLEFLIAGQLIKGAGGAALIPASLALLSHTYSNQRQQAHAVAFVSGASAVAFAAGPVVAGLLINAFSWRAIFVIDVVGALAISWPVWRRLPETIPGAPRHVDLRGQILAIVALASLTSGVIRAGDVGWSSAQTVGPLILAAGTGVLFILVEQRGKAPMVPLSLLRIRSFDVASICGFLVNFAFYGELFVLSLYLQDVRGLSPLDTGWVFVALPISAAISAIPAGRMAARSGPRLPSGLGCTVGALGMLVLSTVDADTSLGVFICGLVLMGLGPGLAIPALTAGLVSGVPRAESGIAAAAFTASRQVGGLLGIAVLGALVGSGDFVPRMQVTLWLSAGAMLLAASLGLMLSSRGPVGPAAVESSVADIAVAAPPAGP